MGRKWIPYALALSIVFAVFALVLSQFDSSHAERSIVKIEKTKKQPEAEAVTRSDRKVASQPAVKPVVINRQNEVVESLNPLENPMLVEKKKRVSNEKEKLNSITHERKEALNLQVVGNGKWFLLSDLQVSQHPIHSPLFVFGPYHVSRKENSQSAATSMSLIYEANQQTLGILTGRLVIKVRDVLDMDLLVREYDLKIENVSTEIRTAYLNASHLGQYTGLNQALKNDQRIERFYFEVVNTGWVRN